MLSILKTEKMQKMGITGVIPTGLELDELAQKMRVSEDTLLLIERWGGRHGDGTTNIFVVFEKPHKVGREPYRYAADGDFSSFDEMTRAQQAWEMRVENIKNELYA